jgi:hypothetical protein
MAKKFRDLVARTISPQRQAHVEARVQAELTRMRLRELRRYVEALGGSLEIVARFFDGDSHTSAAWHGRNPATRNVPSRNGLMTQSVGDSFILGGTPHEDSADACQRPTLTSPARHPR